MDKFDACAKKSSADAVATIKSGGFVPSLAFGMVQSAATEGGITDAVTKFMNSDEDSSQGIRALAAAAKVR